MYQVVSLQGLDLHEAANRLGSHETGDRRIAYANGHYRTASGKPGWQNDCGRMYIVYGPPDEIDSHPNGTPKLLHPFEDWGYRHIEGIGDNLFLKFVD